MTTTTVHTGPAKATADHHLTPTDTYLMYLDSIPHLALWGSVTGQAVTATTDATTEGSVTAWSITVTEYRPGATPATIGHTELVAAMHTLVSSPDHFGVIDEIVAPVRAALAADDNDAATDELCQLDVAGFDVLVQIAVLGRPFH